MQLNIKKSNKWMDNINRHTDVQEANEKMLNITYYQRNANKNLHNEVSPQSEWPSSKKSTNKDVVEGVTKEKSSCTVGGDVN